jgi:hypothetical protein
MPKNHCFRGKEEYFCCSAQDALAGMFVLGKAKTKRSQRRGRGDAEGAEREKIFVI